MNPLPERHEIEITRRSPGTRTTETYVDERYVEALEKQLKSTRGSLRVEVVTGGEIILHVESPSGIKCWVSLGARVKTSIVQRALIECAGQGGQNG